jgi:hypothetical protein
LGGSYSESIESLFAGVVRSHSHSHDEINQVQILRYHNHRSSHKQNCIRDLDIIKLLDVLPESVKHIEYGGNGVRLPCNKILEVGIGA